MSKKVKTSKQVVIIATSIALSGSVLAQTSVRPSFIKAPESQNAPGTLEVKAADKQVAERIVKAMAAKKIYGIDEATQKSLIAGYASNRSLREAIQDIQHQEQHSSSDPQVKSVNNLRLKILTSLSEVDIYNAEQIQKSQSDAEVASQLDLMTLVRGLSPLRLTPNAKTNMIKFLTEVQTSIENGALLGDALRAAKEIVLSETGIEINISLIREAAASSGGVAELFKSVDDVSNIDVSGPSGPVMKVRMTMREAQVVEGLAHEMALSLMELARQPDIGVAFKEKAIQDMKASMTKTSIFIENNPLLDRQSTQFKQISESKESVAESVDELLGALQDLGAEVGGKGVKSRLGRWVRKTIPMADKVIKDPVAWERSLKEKVLEIDKVLADGVTKLDTNNQILSKLKGDALVQMNDLQKNIAKTFLVSQFLQHYIKEQIEKGDNDTANLIKAEIVPRVERELNGAMSLYGVLTASVEAMNELMRTNNLIITNSIQLRTVASPAIAITESVKEAGRDAEKVVQQSVAISRFVEKQLLQMSEQVRKNNELFSKAAGETVVNPEVLDKVLTDLAKEKIEMAKRMSEAGERLHKSNVKLVGVLNNAQQILKQDALGVNVDGILSKQGPELDSKK